MDIDAVVPRPAVTRTPRRGAGHDPTMDAALLLLAATRTDDAATDLAAHARLIRARAVTIRWDSPAARAFATGTDEVVGALASGGLGLVHLAAHARILATRIRASGR